MPSTFRREIAGLRAVAVVSVVLFHLKFSGFQGGFVGVDVFFVISGYLITRNILGELNADHFSFAQFYIRRTRRIFPALIFTVVLTYIAGALWCSPLMFLDLAKEATHALLWISNIQYWRESHQYFAPNSDELALLHCWSLSLEEQFYLVWPLFIVMAWQFWRVFAAITIAAVASFLAALLVTKTDPTAAFFLPPFRIYEFGCGALTLFLESRFKLSRGVREILSGMGLCCVVAGVPLLRPNMPHLELATLATCLGAASMIWAGENTLASRLITHSASIVVGAISYSLYLCHWPIIFFARFIFGEGAETAIGLGIQIMTMFVIAGGMYLFVERRFIQPPGFRPANFVKNAAGFWSVTLGLAAITHITFLSKGFPWRLPAARSELVHLQGFPSNSDLRGLTGPVGVLFVGDSLMLQYAYGLKPILKQLNIDFRAIGGSGCPILYGVTLAKSALKNGCRLARDNTLEELERTSLPVIHAQLWRFYDDAAIEYDDAGAAQIPPIEGSYRKLRLALEATIKRIVARGHRVLLVGAQVDPDCFINLPRLEQGPLPHIPPSPCPLITKKIAETSVEPVDHILIDIQSKWPDRIVFLRTIDYFCDQECPVTKDGIWLYTGRIHLSLAGADYMVGRSGEIFRRFLESR